MIPFLNSRNRVRELEQELITERTAHVLWEDIARDALQKAEAYRLRLSRSSRSRAATRAAHDTTTAKLMEELSFSPSHPVKKRIEGGRG